MKVQLWHLKQSKNSFPCSSLHSLLPPDTLPKNQTAKVNHTWHGRMIPSCFDSHAVQASLPKNYIPKTLIAPGPSSKEQLNWNLKFHFIRLQKSHKYLKGTFSWYNGIGTHLIFLYFFLFCLAKFYVQNQN